MRVCSVLGFLLSCAALALAWGSGVAAALPAWPFGAREAAVRADRPLLAVSCSSARACTGVGGLFADRWNGRRWAARPALVPAFSDPAFDFLSGVSCAARSVCMAVGLSHPPPAANAGYDYSALAEVWDGRTWSDQSPTLSQTSDGYLLAVSCPTASDCIAVGQEVASALAMGWNGHSWTIQLAPATSAAMSVLNGVSCTSVASCFAVGYVAPNRFSPSRALVERWNGIAWSRLPTPSPPPGESAVLNGVSCTGGFCTAVGSVGQRQLVERWNGHKWAIQRPPKDAPSAELNGVSCVSAADCVAVGGRRSDQSLAERWNGSRWSIERTPTPAARSLLWGVSCASASYCAAVGQRGGSPLVERWNGTSWSIR